MKTSTKTTLGAAAATGAALAGAYYLYGSENAASHRRKVKAWAKSAEREIVSNAKKLKNKALTDRNVRALITEAARRYEMTKDLDPKEVREFIASMQKRWNGARKMLVSSAKKGTQRRPRSKKKKAARS
jgi:hypothetical protein